jgi:hypothetical protein
MDSPAQGTLKDFTPKPGDGTLPARNAKAMPPMGVFLFAGMFFGCALGFGVTSVLGVIALGLTLRNAKRRPLAWRVFAVAFLVLLPSPILAVYFYPFATGDPGSNYDILMKNYFFQGLGYGASPGLAALPAGLTTLLAPSGSRP